MASSVYKINKGINKPIEFKGLKAQYIGYLAVGIILLLILFAILYVAGLNMFACLGLVFLLGTVMYLAAQSYSHKFGAHGLMKKTASQSLPSCIKSHSRRTFLKLRAN